MELPITAQNEIYAWACELRRPCYMLKPRIFIDGNKWCALYGENLQDGVAGFGDSPEQAYWDFDKSWVTPLTQTKKEPGGSPFCPNCGRIIHDEPCVRESLAKP